LRVVAFFLDFLLAALEALSLAAGEACETFQFDRKLIALDDKQCAFYVIRIGRGGDLSPVKFESQLKMDHLPPPTESILSDFNNRNFGGTQGLLLRTCKLTCLLAARRTAFVRPHHQNHWHHRIWAYLMLTQQPKL
jgi:hypothetical protein